MEWVISRNQIEGARITVLAGFNASGVGARINVKESRTVVLARFNGRGGKIKP